MTAVGSPNLFTAGSPDINNRFVASRLLYGSLTRVPVPDLARTEFLLVVGANPLVSHGSAVSAPRIRDQPRAIVARGGRVVVVDPRRSAGGANVNLLTSSDPADLESLAGMAHLNGVPIRLDRPAGG